MTVHARALRDNGPLQQDLKKVVEEQKEITGLSAAKKVKRKSSVVLKALKMDVLTIITKAGERIGTLTASLEHAVEEVGS